MALLQQATEHHLKTIIASILDFARPPSSPFSSAQLKRDGGEAIGAGAGVSGGSALARALQVTLPPSLLLAPESAAALAAASAGGSAALAAAVVAAIMPASTAATGQVVLVPAASATAAAAGTPASSFSSSTQHVAINAVTVTSAPPAAATADADADAGAATEASTAVPMDESADSSSSNSGDGYPQPVVATLVDPLTFAPIPATSSASASSSSTATAAAAAVPSSLSSSTAAAAAAASSSSSSSAMDVSGAPPPVIDEADRIRSLRYALSGPHADPHYLPPLMVHSWSSASAVLPMPPQSDSPLPPLIADVPMHLPLSTAQLMGALRCYPELLADSAPIVLDRLNPYA